MSKESGLGWTTCTVDDGAGSPQAITNDVTNLEFSMPVAVQEVTGIDKSAIERIYLLADFSITLEGVFNDDSNMSHDVFKTVASAPSARTVTLVVSGQTLANEVLFTDYPLERSDSGELTWSCEGVLANGVAPTWS